MKPVSLADLSYDQGLQLLSLRKQALDQGQAERMSPEQLSDSYPLRRLGDATLEKAAEFDLQQIGSSIQQGLGSLKDSVQGLNQQFDSSIQQGLGSLKDSAQGLNLGERWSGLDPALQAGLVGTGVGAGAGLGSAALQGRGNYLRNALMGGVAGGAVGGGLGLAAQMNPDWIPDGNTEETPPADNAAAPTPEQNAVDQDVQSLQSLPATERAQNLNRLHSTANSSNPEIAAGLEGAAAGGATGAGLYKLHSMKGYSPDALARHLKNRANDYTDSSLSMLFGFPDSSGLADRIAAMTVEDIKDSLRKGGIKSDLFGRLNMGGTDKVRNLSQTLAKGYPRAPKPASQVLDEVHNVKGFFGAGKRPRAIRSLAGGGLLGLGTLAASSIANQYQENTQARERAKRILSKLIYGNDG